MPLLRSLPLPLRRVRCIQRWRPLVLPLPNGIWLYTAQLEQFLLVKLQLLAFVPGNREIVFQEDRLFGTDLLAVPTVNAAQHVDDETLRFLLDVRVGRVIRAGARRDPDRLGWTHKLAQLT